MEKDYNEMNWSNNYTYKEQNIYISYETKKYILCSFFKSGKGTFKLDKTEFHG